MKPAAFLGHYATRLATVEVNYTFNHLPTEQTSAKWLAQTPSDFLFALKASQRITHIDRLAHPADTLPLFLDRARLLGTRLGPILFQTPPSLRRDDDRLAGFLGELPSDTSCALEFRDPSWYVPEILDLLGTRGVPLVHAEGEKAPSPVETIGGTGTFAYVRLRAPTGYDDRALSAWTERLAAVLADGRDVYAYFRHDDDGANGLAALALRDALDRELRRPPE
ncbi:MAG: DUF72 domain-containing protein [Chloroflexota bacterium]|nr:DUF72 domain-containing protein [Chloroflexota bacterium]